MSSFLLLCAVIMSAVGLLFQREFLMLMNTPAEAFKDAASYSAVCMAGLVFDMKHYGFWLGDALAGFTPFFIGTVFYITGHWKKKTT